MHSHLKIITFQDNFTNYCLHINHQNSFSLTLTLSQHVVIAILWFSKEDSYSLLMSVINFDPPPHTHTWILSDNWSDSFKNCLTKNIPYLNLYVLSWEDFKTPYPIFPSYLPVKVCLVPHFYIYKFFTKWCFMLKLNLAQCFMRKGRKSNRQTDNGYHEIRKVHLHLQLRWAINQQNICVTFVSFLSLNKQQTFHSVMKINNKQDKLRNYWTRN